MYIICIAPNVGIYYDERKDSDKNVIFLLLFNFGLINLLLFRTTLLLVAGNILICDKFYNWFTFENFIFLRIDNYS